MLTRAPKNVETEHTESYYNQLDDSDLSVKIATGLPDWSYTYTPTQNLTDEVSCFEHYVVEPAAESERDFVRHVAELTAELTATPRVTTTTKPRQPDPQNCQQPDLPVSAEHPGCCTETTSVDIGQVSLC